MEKFRIWKAKDPSFTKTFGQNIRFVPYDMIATSDHTVTDIQVAPFRGCLLLRMTDYFHDPNDESVREILNVNYQMLDSAIAYQDIDGKVKIASEGYNGKYIGDAVESNSIELGWFDFASSEFTTKHISDQDDDDEETSIVMEDEDNTNPEEEVDEENVNSDDENQEDDEEIESAENDIEEEESDETNVTGEELASSIENESEDEEKDEDANSDVQHELHENEDMTEVESWSTTDDLHDDEKEEKTLKAYVETDNNSTDNEEKAPTVAANKYRLNQEPRPKFNNKNKKNFKPKNRIDNNNNYNSNHPNNNRPKQSTIPLRNPINRNEELLRKLMGI